MISIKKSKIKYNQGMSYVELIVVLSIFAVLSSVIIFNYGGFQSKVDIKNLASDIALKIVEAQKSSLSGLLPPEAQQSQIDSTWKPSYGVYFNIAGITGSNNSFIYFTDLDNQGTYDGIIGHGCSGECLERIAISRNDTIASLRSFTEGQKTTELSDLTVTFSRPNSGAVLVSGGSQLTDISYVEITVVSPLNTSAIIRLYPSGRVEVK